VRVLVVGGAGYIGSHATHALKRRGHDVVVYDNLSNGYRLLTEGFELVVGDILDEGTLTQVLKRVDAVMHFAALAYVGESVQHPQKYYRNNVLGGLTLLNAVLNAKITRFIFSSTCAVYGIPDKVPIAEDIPRQPVNPYGATKLAFEYILESYERAYGIKYVSFRYFNAAGCDEEGRVGEIHKPETHLIPSAFEAIHGDRPMLDVFGTDYPTKDGTCVRDYIHVTDLAEAHVLGLEHLDKGGESMALNLGTGEGNSVKEVLSMIEKVTGREVPKRFASRRPGDPASLVADPRKAEKLLNWKAKRSLEAIVSSAWQWAEKQRVNAK
jgi:UDP-glucose 4-epimerase